MTILISLKLGFGKTAYFTNFFNLIYLYFFIFILNQVFHFMLVFLS